MKVIIEGQTKEINLRAFKRALKKLEGEDITIWWKYYIGCYDAPVKYKLKKVGSFKTKPYSKKHPSSLSLKISFSS